MNNFSARFWGCYPCSEKGETFNWLKFAFEGAGKRTDRHALTDTGFAGCGGRRQFARRHTWRVVPTPVAPTAELMKTPKQCSLTAK